MVFIFVFLFKTNSFVFLKVIQARNYFLPKISSLSSLSQMLLDSNVFLFYGNIYGQKNVYTF